MKHAIRISAALLLALVLVFPLSVPAAASTLVYDDFKNSGTRDTVCQTLDGTTADDYYGVSYRYEVLSELSASALLSRLRSLMTSTHTKTTSYDDCKTYAYRTDCENENGRVTLLYTSFSATSNNFSGSAPGWNREHVWPKSLGGFSNSGAGADLHHIRPSDVTVNSTRGNLKFGNVSGGSSANGSALVNGMSGGTRGSYFEPRDNVKGDVARICLYVYVRYGGELNKCNSITNVFQSVDVLLEWCEQDPVDTWEMGRNEVVADIQGNRNVFIDYPEYAWLLFGREIPSDMVTPSGMAMAEDEDIGGGDVGGGDIGGGDIGGGDVGGGDVGGGEDPLPPITEDPCTHDGETELRFVRPATCSDPGYTGDLYCRQCSTRLALGENIPPNDEHTFGEWGVVREPQDGKNGLEVRTCINCEYSEGRAIVPPKTNTADNSTDRTVIVVSVAAAGGAALAGGGAGLAWFLVRRRRRL